MLASQDVVIYTLLSIAVYGLLTLGLAGGKGKVVWHPYLGSCLVAAVLEVAITILQAISTGKYDLFALSSLILQVSRVLTLTTFCVLNGWSVLHHRRKKREDRDEVEPLVVSGHPKTQPSYGTVASGDADMDREDSDSEDSDNGSDADEPDDTKKLKKQQRKRLEETGGWIGYLKEYKVFIPMLWPFEDRFIQFCLALIGLTLIAERFLILLVPRQLGVIAEELAKGNGELPWRAVLIWMLLYFLDSPIGIANIRIFAKIPYDQFTYKSLGSNAFAHIMGLSMDFHNEKSSGELQQAIRQGRSLGDLLEFMLYEVLPIIIDLVVAIVYVSFLFDVYMTYILAFAGVGFICVGARTTTWTIKHRRTYNAKFREEGKVQNEAISNWLTVSVFNRNRYEQARYGGAIDDFNAALARYFKMYEFGIVLQYLFMTPGRLAATFLAAYQVSHGSAPIGNFVTLTMYWAAIQYPLVRVTNSIRRVTEMLTDSERLLELFRTQPTIHDVPNATALDVRHGEVVFSDVDFAYDVRKKTLENVSFTVKAGQTIALVGETGGGKSTILKLLNRYYDPTAGRITIDGQNIKEVTLSSLRDSFGAVPQDPALFNMTILENVRYARLDATDAEVEEACRAAAIHDKIESFPDKYQSTVGERGIKLSGGELQRIAIARAILRQPKIVLLDEATSQIDAETEATIHGGLRRLIAGRTTFIVAHRLSTIQHADLILVINDGKIIEQGTHDELIRRNGKYVSLWSKQLSKDVKGVAATLHFAETDKELIDLASGPGVEAQ